MTLAADLTAAVEAFEFTRPAPGQRTLFEQPKPRTAKGQLLLADSGVSDQPVTRPKPEAAMPPEATAPKQVAPLAGQKSMFGDDGLEPPTVSPRFLYHHTSSANRDSITKNGILGRYDKTVDLSDPGAAGGVFLSDKPRHSPGTDVYKVNTHGHPVEPDWTGAPEDESENWYVTYKDIHPRQITRIDHPIGPVEFSAWREEGHIRETTQHDGKEPGEFAPKDGGNGHEIEQEDAARTERAVANAATKPPETFAPVNSPLPKPYLFHDQPLSEITGDIPSRPSWLRKRDAKPLGEWTEAHDFADAATAKYDIQGREGGRGYLVPGIDEVVALMPVAHAQILDDLIAREAAKKAARLHTGVNARHEYADTDWSSIPRFDETSREIAGMHPEIGIRPDDHYAPQKMWDFVREGKYTLPKLHSQDVADTAAAMIAAARKSAFNRPLEFQPEPSEDDPDDEWTMVHHGDADDSDADLVHSGFDPSQFSRTSEIDAIADRMGVDADSLRAALSAMRGSEEDSLIWLRRLSRDPSRGVIRDRDGHVIGFLTRNGKQIQLRDASGKMSGTVSHSDGKSTFRDRRGHMGGSVGEFSRDIGPVEFSQRSFDWDETEHPRDSDGKFAAKLHHTIKQYLSDGTRRLLRDLHSHTGHTKVDALDPTANETTAALKHLRDSGQISSSELAYGEPQFYMTDEQLKKHLDSLFVPPPEENHDDDPYAEPGPVELSRFSPVQ